MDKPRFVEEPQTIQKLLCKNADQCRTQPTELILLDELVEIYAEQLKHETQMLAMDKGVLEPEEVMVIVLIEFLIEQIQHRYFHHALVKVGSPVLDHFHRHNLLGLQILAFDDLSKRALAEDVKDQVAILVAIVFVAENVVNEENVITILVVETVVLGAFARFGEHSSRIA